MWSQFTNVTDGQTDRQTTSDRNTALCTKLHRAVKNYTIQTKECTTNDVIASVSKWFTYGNVLIDYWLGGELHFSQSCSLLLWVKSGVKLHWRTRNFEKWGQLTPLNRRLRGHCRLLHCNSYVVPTTMQISFSLTLPWLFQTNWMIFPDMTNFFTCGAK